MSLIRGNKKVIQAFIRRRKLSHLKRIKCIIQKVIFRLKSHGWMCQQTSICASLWHSLIKSPGIVKCGPSELSKTLRVTCYEEIHFIQ